LAAITDPGFIDDSAEGYTDYEPSNYGKDCIATIRSFVNSVCLDQPHGIVIDNKSQVRKSNIKKQRFSEYVQEYFSQGYQLLRDVLTRWSSTLLMINRVLKLKEVNFIYC
jgi:hypothetical protein